MVRVGSPERAGLGVSLVEVYERVGKFVILVCKNAKRTNRCMAVKRKVEKTFWWDLFICLKDTAFTEVKKDAKF